MTHSNFLSSSLILLAALCMPVPASGQTFEAGRVVLRAESLDSASGLDFGAVEPAGSEGPVRETVSRRVRLTVSNPSARPYRIFQRLDQPPFNARGASVAPEAVRFFETLLTGRGLTRFPNPSPLQAGETEIYVSNGSEENAEILLQYDLSIPAGQSAGSYHSSLTYRIVGE